MNPHRKAVVTLYRKCMRSVKRIPDADQQSIYYNYVRNGFQNRKELPSSSVTTTRAMEDAKEQLERMNYYHSIREEQRPRPSSTAKQHNETFQQPDDDYQTNVVETTTPSTTTTTKEMIVTSWLLDKVPHLHNDDVTYYATRLIEDGFDSTHMLEHELFESDLQHFMKKAHLRALLKQIEGSRKDL